MLPTYSALEHLATICVRRLHAYMSHLDLFPALIIASAQKELHSAKRAP